MIHWGWLVWFSCKPDGVPTGELAKRPRMLCCGFTCHQAWLQPFPSASPELPAFLLERPGAAASRGHAAPSDLGDRDKLSPPAGDLGFSWLLL